MELLASTVGKKIPPHSRYSLHVAVDTSPSLHTSLLPLDSTSNHSLRPLSLVGALTPMAVIIYYINLFSHWKHLLLLHSKLHLHSFPSHPPTSEIRPSFVTKIENNLLNFLKKTFLTFPWCIPKTHVFLIPQNSLHSILKPTSSLTPHPTCEY